jgi:hypothetical protein
MIKQIQIKDFEKLVGEALWELIKNMKVKQRVEKIIKEDDEMRLFFSCIPDHITFRVFDYQDEEDGFLITPDDEWKDKC